MTAISFTLHLIGPTNPSDGDRPRQVTTHTTKANDKIISQGNRHSPGRITTSPTLSGTLRFLKSVHTKPYLTFK